jgi:hypothetical protein
MVVINKMPENMNTRARVRPTSDTGTMSPYPIVVTVSITHHNESPRVFIPESGTVDSIPYITNVPTSITKAAPITK